MNDLCQNLLLTSLTDYYNDNTYSKIILKEIITGKHKLSLRLIDWLVTHYSKSNNNYYWIYKNNNIIYNTYPRDISKVENIKKINIYLDYRAQLKSYTKLNFDSFRRHNRITFFLDSEKQDFIETTVGQLNFFRWAFNNNIIEYALINYDVIYNNMILNNSYNNKNKTNKQNIINHQEITKTLCTLRFD